MVHLYPLKSINRPLEPGLRAPGPLVQASIEITDEAGTISSAWPQRNPTYRPSSLNNMYNAPPPSHRLYTRTASKMALAEHHLQLDTLPPFLSIMDGNGPTLNWPQHCLWQSMPQRPGWYGMV